MDSFYNIHSILLHKIPIYLSANQSNQHPAVQTGPQARPCVDHSTKRKERQFYLHYRSFMVREAGLDLPCGQAGPRLWEVPGASFTRAPVQAHFDQKQNGHPLRNDRLFLVREAGLEPARPEWALEPETILTLFCSVFAILNSTTWSRHLTGKDFDFCKKSVKKTLYSEK